MTKLCYFTYILDQGGAERVLSYLDTNMPEMFSSKIVLYQGSRVKYPHKGEVIDFNLPLPPYKNFYHELYVFLRAVIKLTSFKAKYRPHISISLTETPNLINFLSFAKSKTVLWVHSHKSSSFSYSGIQGVLAKVIVAMLYNRSNLIVAVSKGVAMDLVDNFDVDSNKIRVIYNPVDTKIITEKMHEPLEDLYSEIFEKPVIITVGRLTHAKAQWNLLRAFKIISTQIGDVNLVILGDGELKEYLIKLADGLGIREKVHFIGFQENPFKFVARAKLFVMTSIFEGLGMVLQEALACNTPIISTDCKCGPREILAPDTDFRIQTQKVEYAKYGILVPPFSGTYKGVEDEFTENENLLASTMLDFLNNDRVIQYYKNLSSVRLKDFSIQGFINEWVDIVGA